jgi:hypothetical protein
VIPTTRSAVSRSPSFISRHYNRDRLFQRYVAGARAGRPSILRARSLISIFPPPGVGGGWVFAQVLKVGSCRCDRGAKLGRSHTGVLYVFDAGLFFRTAWCHRGGYCDPAPSAVITIE